MAISRIIQMVILALLALLLTTTGAVADTPVGTKFTYQGRLTDGANPANGAYDFQFRLYDALTTGNPEGVVVTKLAVNVSNGLFAVELDFGSAVFKGDARWLSIAVKKKGAASYTLLSPRQPINTTPYAISSAWSGLSGVPSGFADGVDNDTKYSVGPGLVLNGSTEFALDSSGLSDNNIVKFTGSGATLVRSQISDNGTWIDVGTAPSVTDYLLGVSSGQFTRTLRVHNTKATGISAIIGSASGSGGSTHIGLEGLASGATSNKAVSGTANIGGATNNYGGYFTASGATNNFSIYTDGGKVYVKDQVGIGDLTPNAKLDVEHGGLGEDGIRINATHSSLAGRGDPILGFEVEGVKKFTMGVDDSDGDKFKIGTSALTTNTRLTIESNGEVGIGTTAPGQKLHVAGSAFVSGNLGIGDVTPDAKLDVVGDVLVSNNLTLTGTAKGFGVVTAKPVVGMWLPNSTTLASPGFAGWGFQKENSDSSYLDWVDNRTYIKILKPGWYMVIVDLTMGTNTATLNNFVSIEVLRTNSTGSTVLSRLCGADTRTNTVQRAHLSCTGVDFFNANDWVRVEDENSGDQIIGGTSTNPISSMKILKLN